MVFDQQRRGNEPKRSDAQSAFVHWPLQLSRNPAHDPYALRICAPSLGQKTFNAVFTVASWPLQRWAAFAGSTEPSARPGRHTSERLPRLLRAKYLAHRTFHLPQRAHLRLGASNGRGNRSHREIIRHAWIAGTVNRHINSLRTTSPYSRYCPVHSSLRVFTSGAVWWAGASTARLRSQLALSYTKSGNSWVKVVFCKMSSRVQASASSFSFLLQTVPQGWTPIAQLETLPFP